MSRMASGRVLETMQVTCKRHKKRIYMLWCRYFLLFLNFASKTSQLRWLSCSWCCRNLQQLGWWSLRFHLQYGWRNVYPAAISFEMGIANSTTHDVFVWKEWPNIQQIRPEWDGIKSKLVPKLVFGVEHCTLACCRVGNWQWFLRTTAAEVEQAWWKGFQRSFLICL